MKKLKLAGPGIDRQRHTVGQASVTPSDSAGVLFLGVLGVENQ